jgi:hypothetical protein
MNNPSVSVSTKHINRQMWDSAIRYFCTPAYQSVEFDSLFVLDSNRHQLFAILWKSDCGNRVVLPNTTFTVTDTQRRELSTTDPVLEVERSLDCDPYLVHTEEVEYIRHGQPLSPSSESHSRANPATHSVSIPRSVTEKILPGYGKCGGRMSS